MNPENNAKSGFVRHLSLLLKKSVPEQFHTDTQILDRLVYKNRNQHRSGKHFQHVLEVRRAAKKIIHLNVSAAAKAVLDSMGVPNPKKYKPSHLDAAPDQKSIALLLSIIESSHMLLKHLRSATGKAYISLKQLASLSYFIPICLTLMAVCARLHHYASIIVKDLEDAYSALHGHTVLVLKYSGAVRISDELMIDLSKMPKAIDSSCAELVLPDDLNLFGDADTAQTALSSDGDDDALNAPHIGAMETLAPELDSFFSAVAEDREDFTEPRSQKESGSLKEFSKKRKEYDSVEEAWGSSQGSKKVKSKLAESTKTATTKQPVTKEGKTGKMPTMANVSKKGTAGGKPAEQRKSTLPASQMPQKSKQKVKAKSKTGQKSGLDEIDSIFGL
ncbi:hypothetical protein BJ741DRAFT_588467 [Chytriomyces cf. hyalinus JEL632]|nr:hypothetical protein BJ741DRAFT_588467 [Chytriomyces cf. hyalinus JEL632]